MRPKIVVVGSINMDLVVRTPHLPKTGETILGSDFLTIPGGKGANQAVAAGRLGAEVHMVARVGRDGFGEQLLANLTRDGIHTSQVIQDDAAPSGVALITVDQAGQNTIVVASGANARLTPQDVEAARPAFSGASVLLLQLETPLETVERAIQIARENGVKVVLNPAPARTDIHHLLPGVDYLIPNQTELAQLGGSEVLGVAAKQVQALGVDHLVVTLGDQGVWLLEAGQEKRLPAHSVTAVDTVAAGDAFVGAFGVALAEGRSASQAAAWGNAAAAISVTRHGAQPSLPKREELEAFLREAVH